MELSAPRRTLSVLGLAVAIFGVYVLADLMFLGWGDPQLSFSDLRGPAAVAIAVSVLIAGAVFVAGREWVRFLAAGALITAALVLDLVAHAHGYTSRSFVIETTTSMALPLLAVLCIGHYVYTRRGRTKEA